MQGLQNLGSTCAINSLIQIICRTEHLRNVILNQDIQSSDTLTYQLKEILTMMHCENHSLSPKKFVGYIFKHFDGIFRQGEQLDVGELWMFLFDKIATECGIDTPIFIHNTSYEISLKDLEHTNVNIARCSELFDRCETTIHRINNNKTSLWLQSCQGIMMGMIQCSECHSILYNFEPFTSIPLDIPDTDMKPSVATMFRNYLQPQVSEGDWKCEKCNKNTSYTKILKIWKMPPVLMFVIKRFINIHQKNTRPIKVNTKICIKQGSIISSMDQDYTYKCTAMALHYGSLSGGHYCALCQSNNQFVLYDDLNMSLISQENMQKSFDNNTEGYMLVYTL